MRFQRRPVLCRAQPGKGSRGVCRALLGASLSRQLAGFTEHPRNGPAAQRLQLPSQRPVPRDSEGPLSSRRTLQSKVMGRRASRPRLPCQRPEACRPGRLPAPRTCSAVQVWPPRSFAYALGTRRENCLKLSLSRTHRASPLRPSDASVSAGRQSGQIRSLHTPLTASGLNRAAPAPGTAPENKQCF